MVQSDQLSLCGKSLFHRSRVNTNSEYHGLRDWLQPLFLLHVCCYGKCICIQCILTCLNELNVYIVKLYFVELYPDVQIINDLKCMMYKRAMHISKFFSFSIRSLYCNICLYLLINM